MQSSNNNLFFPLKSFSFKKGFTSQFWQCGAGAYFFFLFLQLFHIFISVPTLEVTSFLHQLGTSWSCPSLAALSLTALVWVSRLAGFQNVYLDSEQGGKSGNWKGSMQRGKAISPSAAGLCVMSYSEPKPVSLHLIEKCWEYVSTLLHTYKAKKHLTW